MKRTIIIVLCAAFALSNVSCGWSKKAKGAAIGATSGAVIGGVIGNKAGNTAVGAIIGAAIGERAGAHIGNYVDIQAEEMRRDLEGATVTRVGEGIKITFASGILFDVDKWSLQPAGVENIAHLAAILNKYPDTEVLVEGHTDSDGSEEHNLDLSQNRANSAKNSLVSNGVSPGRLTTMAYGEVQPIADNVSDEGKQANRRVEIAVFANDKLKKAAQAGG